MGVVVPGEDGAADPKAPPAARSASQLPWAFTRRLLARLARRLSLCQVVCWSEYYWAVSVSLEVLHVSHVASGATNATREVVTHPRGAPASVTLRPPTPWFADADALARALHPAAVVPCAVEPATGAVRVPENFTAVGGRGGGVHAADTAAAAAAAAAVAVTPPDGDTSSTAPATPASQRPLRARPGNAAGAARRQAAPPRGGPVPGSPGPLAVVVLHALWGSFLDGLGVARRPPPLWLIRMGWLPWWRVVGPGVPLLSLSSLRTAVRCADLNTGVLDALIVPAMLAAAAEAACAVLAETQVAAHERARTGASMLPVWCALAYVLSCALLVVLCVAEPVARELRRAWRVLNGGGSGGDNPHPLGETLPRSNSGRLRPLTRSQTAAGLRLE